MLLIAFPGFGSLFAQVTGEVAIGQSLVPDTIRVYEFDEVTDPPSFPSTWTNGMSACSLGEITEDCYQHTKVFVSFIVETDGSVREARVMNSTCAALEHVALCQVGHFGLLRPGMLHGNPVRTRIKFPMVIDLR